MFEKQGSVDSLYLIGNNGKKYKSGSNAPVGSYTIKIKCSGTASDAEKHSVKGKQDVHLCVQLHDEKVSVKIMPFSPGNTKHRSLLRSEPSKLLEIWNPSPPHQLFCVDNRTWLANALNEGEQFDLIYMDPPFCSGADLQQTITMDGIRHEVDGFRDIFTVDAYLQFIYERVVLLKEVLIPTGSIFVHCDHQQSHNIRAILDEVFGAKQFRNEKSSGIIRVVGGQRPTSPENTIVSFGTVTVTNGPSTRRTFGSLQRNL